MDIKEYEKVKDYTYLEYCEYLQNKYGKSKYDYFTASFYKNRNVTRTKEGLVAHHKYEDHMIMLSTPEIARNYPFEWQKKENIIYCDYLEHLFLHILACEYPSPDKEPLAKVGYGGVVNLIGPELNDLYSGWQTKQEWRKNCHDLVRNDKDVYLVLLERFISKQENLELKELTKSFNGSLGLWDENKNQEIYEQIEGIYKRYQSKGKSEIQEKYKRKLDDVLAKYNKGTIGARRAIRAINDCQREIYRFGYSMRKYDISDFSTEEMIYFPYSSEAEINQFYEKLYKLIDAKEDYSDPDVCNWCIFNFGDKAAVKIPEKYFNMEWGYHLIDKHKDRIPEGTDMRQLYKIYVSQNRKFKINSIPEKYRSKSVYLKYALNSSSAKVFFNRYEEMPDKYKDEVLFKNIIKNTEYKAVREFFKQKLQRE